MSNFSQFAGVDPNAYDAVIASLAKGDCVRIYDRRTGIEIPGGLAEVLTVREGHLALVRLDGHLAAMISRPFDPSFRLERV